MIDSTPPNNLTHVNNEEGPENKCNNVVERKDPGEDTEKYDNEEEDAGSEEVSSNPRSDHTITTASTDETIAEIIRDELDLDEVPKEKTRRLVAKVTRSVMHKLHMGPLPAPEDFAQYNAIIPNAGERILKLAEDEKDHRLGIEKKLVHAKIAQDYFGQFFGFIIAMSAMGLGGYCILQGHDAGGTIIGGVGLTGLVSVFVIGKRQSAKKN